VDTGIIRLRSMLGHARSDDDDEALIAQLRRFNLRIGRLHFLT